MNFHEHLRERACPVCGSKDHSRVLHRANFDERQLDSFAFASRKLPELMHLNLVGCPTCTLTYASPAFTPGFLASAYETASYDSTDEANYAAATYAKLLPTIRKRLLTAEAALDVGTGNGGFLGQLQKAGFTEVIGVEPSTAAADRARPDIRPLIRLGMFEAADFTPHSLDLVSCFQTMEHLENPREFCVDAFRLLKPGGALYLITHDSQSWVTRLLGRKSPIFDVEHQQLFTHSSLRFLLTACGFEQVEITTIWNRYPVSYWSKLAPVPRPVKTKLLQMLSLSGIGRLPLTVNIGNLAVVAYKPRQ